MGARLFPTFSSSSRAGLVLAVVGLCLVAAAGPVHADAEKGSSTSGPPRNQLGAALGAVHMQTHDALVRGLQWTGGGAELDLLYRNDGPDGQHVASLRFPFGLLKNRYDHRGLAWDAQVDYGYAHCLKVFERDVALSLGARLRWDWAVQFYGDFDEEHIYWMTAFELAPMLVVRWDHGRNHALVADLDTSLVSLVSRPPEQRYYKIDRLTVPAFFFDKTHDGMRVTSIHEHATARLRLQHETRWREHAVVAVRYAFDFAFEAEPARFMIMMHSLSVGLTHAF